MDKAEKRALEVYPVKRFYYTEDHYIPTSRDDGYEYYTQEVRDENLESRKKFMEGYRMAEEDLELTWEDVREIQHLLDVVWSEQDITAPIDEDTIYKESLKRFKEAKYGK